MSGWLVAIPYEGDPGVPTHEALCAVWHEDEQVALQLAKEYGPRGAQITARIVTTLRDSMLRGLKLRPGEAALLSADQPRI